MRRKADQDPNSRLRRARGCAPGRAHPESDSYSAIVDSYIRDHRESARDELKFYRNQRTLRDVVHVGAMAIRPDGNRHPHQFRRSVRTLKAARDKLVRTNLRTCRSFDQLHQTIQRAIGGIHDIGPLTVYDTALRIGAFLGLEPEVVYLHRGTKEGAKAIGLNPRTECLDVDELPAAFTRLKPYEIEDCLCMYERQLGGVARRRARGCR